ncbi:MAG: DoxX family protein [Bacteriovoracaceae bacterium]|nr:DoxX family protein [Bacteriovoracaceae bacterium]
MLQDIGLLFLRLSIGFMMLLAHGWPKLAGFTAKSATFPGVLGMSGEISLTLAVFSEFFCSIALILGVLTRWVSIPLLITMLVAAFLIHGGDPWKKQEFALLYAIPYLTLILTGGGKFSIDSLIFKKN